MNNLYQTATFGGGCFWCTEAIFKRIKGVFGVTSGYAGGKRENPSYDQVSSGVTGHAEVVQIKFDPKVIDYPALLDIFFNLHDPTTLNRQGNDIGTQYRSIIFYHTSKQKEEIKKAIDEIVKKKTYKDAIVTEIVPFDKFYPAENYHQDYFDKNKTQPYCSLVIAPKIHKLIKRYGDKVKE